MHAQKVDKYLEGALNLLAPRRCCWCQARIARGHSCEPCRAQLPWNRVACDRCALPLAGPPAPGRLCPSCSATPPPQDRAFVPLRYEAPVAARILDLKFHGQLQLAAIFADLLVPGLANRPDPLPDLLVPVPLHRHRLFGRGYNQALEIGRALAAVLAVPLRPDAARRRSPTAEQTRLSAAQRQRNVRGAFSFSAIAHGRSIALLDDVVTTGATAAELARSARAAGAVRVEVWAVARAALSA